MHRRTALRMIATSVSVSVLCVASAAVAQEKSIREQLVGTWAYVSGGAQNPDGTSVWGENAKGIVIFTADGFYSTHLLRSDRPKFAANSRLKGTPEENAAAVRGGVANFGTYTVNEAEKSFTVKFEGSTYPNLEGTQQTRRFTIEGDELRVTNPSPTAGGPPSQLVYKRRAKSS